LRQSEPARRVELLRHHEVRRAVGESLPALSGLVDEIHSAIVKEELAKKFPDETRALDEAEAMVEAARNTIKNARLSVESELSTVQEPAAEAPLPAAAQSWVA